MVWNLHVIFKILLPTFHLVICGIFIFFFMSENKYIF